MRTKICMILAVATSACLFAQSATPSPAFDVASVKRTPAGSGTSTRMNETAGTINYINVPLKSVIRRAYQLQDSQIAGPDWLNDERYDISARYPPNTPTRERGTMLQNLLVERFKLAGHHETKNSPAYRLVVEKGGPKMQKIDAIPSGFGTKIDAEGHHLRSKTSLRALAVFLADQLRLPVPNETELEGTFDIALDWTPDDDATPERTGPSIFTAVREQLGLKLESTKAPTQILVIDHAEKVPVEN